MLNLDLFTLHSGNSSKNIVQLSKLILASHLSKASSGISGGLESLIPAIGGDEDDGAQDNLSANSDADPIVEIAGSETENEQSAAKGTKGASNNEVIREEDLECDDEPSKPKTMVIEKEK